MRLIKPSTLVLLVLLFLHGKAERTLVVSFVSKQHDYKWSWWHEVAVPFRKGLSLVEHRGLSH